MESVIILLNYWQLIRLCQKNNTKENQMHGLLSLKFNVYFQRINIFI